MLAETFMVKIVLPYISNLGKRLVKSPKVYIADSGITAALLQLHNFNEINGHPAFGAIWEQIVLSNLQGEFPQSEIYFYRTAKGAEIDFVMKYRNRISAIECKNSLSPVLQRGFYNAIEDIAPVHSFIVAPVKKGWAMKKGIDVVSIGELTDRINWQINNEPH